MDNVNNGMVEEIARVFIVAHKPRLAVNHPQDPSTMATIGNVYFKTWVLDKGMLTGPNNLHRSALDPPH